MGVYPFLLPLRPIPGTALGSKRPPGPERMKGLYRKGAQRVLESGLSWRRIPAGCGRCEACSALPDMEDSLQAQFNNSYVVPAIRPAEFKACLDIRKSVFLKAQGINGLNEPDEIDERAIQLALIKQERIVGTVRVHQEDGTFWGSRLAVVKQERGGSGASLIKAAEDQARSMGGKEISGQVQKDAVPFFKKLGWHQEGPVFSYHDIEHVIMCSPRLY